MQNWFIISEKLGNLSFAITKEDRELIQKGLVEIIAILLKIAEDNSINMQEAWGKWRTKALSKKYD